MARTYDLLLFHGFQASGEFLAQMAIFDTDRNGEVCTGIAKLAQRWLMEFLTDAGSMLWQPERGCTFMQAMQFGRLRNEDDVRAEFQFCRSQVAQNLIKEESAGMPADERYQDAALQRINLLADGLQIYVLLTSQAGTTRTVLAPIRLSSLSL